MFHMVQRTIAQIAACNHRYYVIELTPLLCSKYHEELDKIRITAIATLPSNAALPSAAGLQAPARLCVGWYICIF